MPSTLPVPDPAAFAHSEQLRAHIAEALRAAGGWLPFSRYMEMALYAPGLGYYAAGSTKFGAAGDFVTAPTLTPLFGQTVARTVAAVLAETGGEILELGAGEGHLAADLLNGLADLGALPSRYCILEVSADLRARQQARLAESASPWLDRVVWLEALPTAFTGVILGNELLDALPVDVLHRRIGEGSDKLFERGVVRAENGGFAWADRPVSSADLRALGGAFPAVDDYVSEVSLAVPALIRSLAARLERGALLFFDYGFPRAEFYHPQRSQGTLMCHYRHHSHDDPFWLPGLNDITAHVDFSAVAEAGRQEGLDLLGYTSQGAYLLQAGLLDQLATLEVGTAAYLRAVVALQKLIQPHEMGELFKVIAFGRGLSVALPGFVGNLTGRDRGHAL